MLGETGGLTPAQQQGPWTGLAAHGQAHGAGQCVWMSGVSPSTRTTLGGGGQPHSHLHMPHGKSFDRLLTDPCTTAGAVSPWGLCSCPRSSFCSQLLCKPMAGWGQTNFRPTIPPRSTKAPRGLPTALTPGAGAGARSAACGSSATAVLAESQLSPSDGSRSPLLTPV